MENRIIQILIYILLCGCHSAFSQKLSGIPNDTINLNTVVVYKKDFTPVQLKSLDTERKIYILKHEKSCLRCFGELSGYINTLIKPNDSIQMYSLTLTDFLVFQVKKGVYENQKYMPEITEPLFVFTPANADDMGLDVALNSVFKFYNIDITPAVIMQYKDRVVIIRYQDMYFDTYFSKNAVSLAFFKTFR
jgi:hypothetical protein